LGSGGRGLWLGAAERSRRATHTAGAGTASAPQPPWGGKVLAMATAFEKHDEKCG
jgi:hypothetical protein